MPEDNDFITIVSGLPRSGTSMMMRMLDQGGMPIVSDALREADTDNPLGYYEFEPVKKLANDSSWLPIAYNKAVKIIYIFLYSLPKQYRYKVLFMNRNLEEVIASQKAMLRRRKEADRMSDQQLADSFAEQLSRLDLWIRNQDNLVVRYFDYQDVVNDPTATAIEVVRFLGRKLDVDAMIRSVDPSLHRNRSKDVSTIAS